MHRSTHLPTRGLGLALVTTLALTACGADDGGLSSDPTGSVDEASRFTVSGFVSESGGGPSLAGARVCIAAQTEVPCAVTDASGQYALRLPESWKKPRELALTVTAAGYASAVRMVRESPTFDRDGVQKDGTWPHNIFLKSDEEEAALKLDPSAASALVELAVLYKDSGAPEGASATITPDGEKSPTGLAGLGRALNVPKSGEVVFANVPPGRFELSVAGCTPQADLDAVWPGRARNAVAGLAIQGSVTRVTLRCQEARPGAKTPSK